MPQVIRDATMVEMLCCLHLSRNVSGSDVFPNRGGLLLVSSSGALKTTLLKILVRYGDFRAIGDLSVRGLNGMRDALIDGVVNTFGFYEMRKLYERREDVARSMEMAISQLIEEGYGLANWQDQTVPVSLARCMAMGALTRSWYDTKVGDWKDSLMRRLLISHYSLDQPQALVDAVVKWERLPIGGKGILPQVPLEPIRNSISPKERKQVEGMFRRYRGDVPATPFQVYCKALAVLRWHRDVLGRKDDTMERAEEFAQTFSAEPLTKLVIDQQANGRKK